MLSVLHVSSGASAPVIAPTFSRLCSSAASSSPASSPLAALPRRGSFSKSKFSLSSSLFQPCTISNFLKPISSAKSFTAPSLSQSPPGSPSGWSRIPRSWLSKFRMGGANHKAAQMDAYNSTALGVDDDKPAAGQQFATFGAGCFWGVELAFQRVPGVYKTEVGYTQGLLHSPTYADVCEGDSKHSEVVRVEFNPLECPYEKLLQTFWGQHDPTTLNRQGGDRGTQYRSGIYFYSPEQESAAKESMQKEQEKLTNKIVTEILPAKKFYRAEEYHQQYLAKGGRHGFRQSPAKGCTDPIRCYG